jgi:hypothetical protein
VKLAELLEINPRTLADWKKDRVKLYKRLKWSYEAEELLKELQAKNSDNMSKINEVLQGS